MPDLLIHPADSEAIGACRFRRPLQHALVVGPWSLEDAVAADGKLSTAYIPDMLGDFCICDVEDYFVDLREEGADVVPVDVDLCWVPGVDARWAPRVMLAPEVNVAHRIDSIKADIAQGRRHFRAKEIVVPLVDVGVDEDRVGREVVVVIDDVGQVCGGLTASGCAGF